MALYNNYQFASELYKWVIINTSIRVVKYIADEWK